MKADAEGCPIGLNSEDAQSLMKLRATAEVHTRAERLGRLARDTANAACAGHIDYPIGMTAEESKQLRLLQAQYEFEPKLDALMCSTIDARGATASPLCTKNKAAASAQDAALQDTIM